MLYQPQGSAGSFNRKDGDAIVPAIGGIEELARTINLDLRRRVGFRKIGR